jgi:hypothetical protein
MSWQPMHAFRNNAAPSEANAAQTGEKEKFQCVTILHVCIEEYTSYVSLVIPLSLFYISLVVDNLCSFQS